MKKHLTYILCFFLTACGEKAEEKIFLDKNIKSFLEYAEIANVTPKISLSNILTKMSELKLHIQDHKFSPNCQKSVEYIVENMTIMQNMYKNFSLKDTPIVPEILAFQKANTLIREVLKYKTCKKLITVVNRRKYIAEQNDSLQKEVTKENPNLELVKKYIKNGADVNAKTKNDKTALMFAAESNRDTAVIRTLIKAGANVNARETLFGDTVLMHAAMFNSNPSIIEILIKAGADINAKNISNGDSALILAAMFNQNPAIIETLVNAGIDINTKSTSFGDTALIRAVSLNKSPIIIKALIRAGANINTTDVYRKTALDYAETPQVIEILKEHKTKKIKTIRKHPEIFLPKKDK